MRFPARGQIRQALSPLQPLGRGGQVDARGKAFAPLLLGAFLRKCRILAFEFALLRQPAQLNRFFSPDSALRRKCRMRAPLLRNLEGALLVARIQAGAARLAMFRAQLILLQPLFLKIWGSSDFHLGVAGAEAPSLAYFSHPPFAITCLEGEEIPMLRGSNRTEIPIAVFGSRIKNFLRVDIVVRNYGADRIHVAVVLFGHPIEHFRLV